MFWSSGGNSINVITAFEQHFPGVQGSKACEFGKIWGTVKRYSVKSCLVKSWSFEHLKEFEVEYFDAIFTLSYAKMCKPVLKTCQKC